MTAPLSRGKLLQASLLSSLRDFERGAVVPDRERPIIWNVTSGGVLVGGQTLDGFLAQAGHILVDSGKVYRWEDSIVVEHREPSNQRLLLLCVQGRADPHAPGVLSNLFAVGVRGDEGASQSLTPGKLVNALLADEGLWARLPAIRTYSRRPVFDEDFALCGPGWHADRGILIHGPDVEPAVLPPADPAAARSIDRMLPLLRRLFHDFCFASDADLENALGLLLTGLLVNHLVAVPKPVGLIDGNQPEVGKTLLGQVIGQVLDGREPERIPLVKDEELEKKVGAKLRESLSSIFFFDNVKSQINSPFIEANALSPLLSVRLLGHSRNINRPNTYLWLVASNLTSGSSDMMTRGAPVRLRFEGDPAARSFHEDLLEFAAEHRLAILGELAALVLRWTAAGRPDARDVWPAGRPAPRHRCQAWAGLIGGILGVSGFTNFLANVEEAKAAMDEGLQTLATLAEYVLGKNNQGFSNPPDNDAERGKLPRDWAALFISAGVCRDKLADKNVKGRDTWVGTFLSGKTDRPVSVSVGANSGTAVLRRNTVRSDQKRYYFEITPNAPKQTTPPAPGGCPVGQPHGCGPNGAVEPPPPPSTSDEPESAGAGGGPVEETGPTPPGNGLEWV
jgi:hypothetical protein